MAVPVAHAQGDVGALVAQAGQLPPLVDLDRVHGPGGAVEQLLELGLKNIVAPGQPEGPGSLRSSRSSVRPSAFCHS